MEEKFYKAAIIVFIGSLATNVTQFIFHFATGRLLGPGEYSALTALIAITLILYVPYSAGGLGITKEISKLKVKGKEKEINYLISKYTITFTKNAILLFMILVFLSLFIAEFLHTDVASTVMVMLSIVFIAPSMVIIASLNGLQKFNHSMEVNFINALGKLLLGTLGILLGLSLFGAVGGLPLGALLSVIVGYWILRKRFSGKKTKFNISIKKDIVVITAALLFVNALGNIDLILARHFLPINEAGIYAAASQIGKMIFYLTGSLALIVIPKTTEKVSLKLPPTKIILKTILAIIAISIPPLIIYLLFPDLVVKILYGEKYFTASGLILLYGIAMVCYSIIFSLTHYFVGTNRNNFIILLAGFNLIEILIIIVNHKTAQDITVSILLTMAIALLITIFYGLRKRILKQKTILSGEK